MYYPSWVWGSWIEFIQNKYTWITSRLYQMIRGNIELYLNGKSWMSKGEFSDSIFPPEALGELEVGEFLHLSVGNIAPGQKQQQLRGRRPGKAFPASSQIEGFDGTNTATVFCGLKNCRCHSTWMLFLTTTLHCRCHPPFKIAKCLTQQHAYYLLRHRQGCATCCSLAAGLRGNGERMRKWRENEEIERRWRENEEMDREWGNGQRIRKGTENEEMDR